MSGKEEPLKPEAKSRVLIDVRALARVLRQYDLTEIEVDRDGQRIRLCRTAALPASAALPVVAAAAAPNPSAAPLADTEDDDDLVTITSPFVGTFYRSPSPTAPPFVEVGQVVAKGATLCIVEAMKLMNEIEAELDFKVVAVLVKNGDPVEFGQALFKAEPL